MNDMNSKVYKNVVDYKPMSLPKPKPRKLVDEDGKELKIITVTCEGIEW